MAENQKMNRTEKVNNSNNIAFICPNLINCSPINALISLAIHFAKNHGVVIVVWGSSKNADRQLLNAIKDNNILIHFLEYNSIYHLPLAKIIAQKILKKERIKLAFSFLFRADILLATLKGEFVKVSSQRDTLFESIRISHGPLIAFLTLCIQKYCFNRLDKIVVMSDEMKKYYASQHPSNIHKLTEVPNFLDEARLSKYDLTRPIFQFNKKLPTLVAVGSIIKRKRIELLISYVFKLLDEGFSLNLLIIGDGPLMDSTRNYLCSRPEFSSNICIAGELRNPYADLMNSDIYVSASASEGISRSAMEALYFNKPCLLSDISSHNILRKECDGVYVFSDFESFKSGIIEIIERSPEAKLNQKYLQLHGHSAYLNFAEDCLAVG
jgi:glycosyltransferase involved in cell wall biosynthesis